MFLFYQLSNSISQYCKLYALNIVYLEWTESMYNTLEFGIGIETSVFHFIFYFLFSLTHHHITVMFPCVYCALRNLRVFFFFLRYCGLNPGPTPWTTPPALFVMGFFQDRVLWTICPGWLRTAILLISAFWVSRIIGMSHQHPDGKIILNPHI
jgi:hypothetical protein